MMAKRRASRISLRTWLIRAAIGIVVGIFAGFGIGVLAVKALQAPVTLSSAATADSTRRPRGPSPVSETPAPDPDAEKPKNGIVVPQLIGMEEGDARQAVLHAGFSVGSVTFKASREPLGTVVASFPVPGEAVVLPAQVNIILSDGKGKADSAAVPPPQDDNSSSTPDAS